MRLEFITGSGSVPRSKEINAAVGNSRRGATWTDVAIDCLGILSVGMVVILQARWLSSAVGTARF
jgi:hypothetical protein